MGLQLLWPSAPSARTIVAGHVHVYAWLLHGEATNIDAHLSLLQPEEVERAARFKFLRHRGDYVLAHAYTRRILAAYTGIHPEEIVFATDKFGKPRITRPRTELTFNLSHTKGLCVLAVSHGQEIGIDVERLRHIEKDVALGHFSPRELADLDCLAEEAWLTGFYRCWTSKEALLKAEGVGLNIPLDSFDVALLPESQPELLATRPQAGFTRAWQMHALHPADHVIGTLATPPGAAVFCFRYE